MSGAAMAWFGDRVRGGVVVAPGESRRLPPLDAVQGGHPMPTEGSLEGGRRALAMAEGLLPDETLVVLLSGGASALLAAPAVEVSLEDLGVTTARLMHAGADIRELNAVRRHLSGIKGGWLAARAAGPVVTYAISDVVGDEPSDIGSGPTVPDPTTFADALGLLERFGGLAAYPAPIVTRLRRGAAGDGPDTPKPGDARLARATWRLVGGRRVAMAGAFAEAVARGYAADRIEDAVVGDARTAGGPLLGAAIARAAGLRRPACIVSSGETTVRVTGTGRGGRNQELVLGALDALAAVPGAALASVGTDGVDGPTDAAGAMADATTLAQARAAGLAPETFLHHNDAYAFFRALGGLIQTGATDTNVGDLQVILLA